MDYECEKCQTTLGPGTLFCPVCGDKFPQPVPGTLQSKPESLQPAVAPVPPSPTAYDSKNNMADLASGLSKVGGGLMGCGCLLGVLVIILAIAMGAGH